jgi:hypothetical protein
VDAKRRVVYVGTGNSYGPAAADTSDSILALSMDDGHIVWKHQEFSGDAFVLGCRPTNAAGGVCTVAPATALPGGRHPWSAAIWMNRWRLGPGGWRTTGIIRMGLTLWVARSTRVALTAGLRSSHITSMALSRKKATTIALDPEYDRLLSRAARERAISRSEFIRQHLALVLEQYRRHPRPRSAGAVRALAERGDERELFGAGR